ncbi:hypothetical protein C8R47DRAFT_1323209 [Mycena vitilis]|nr:hypothetical protein C8R47DRAFT_1323209 [Mycena vitilis]
MLPSRSSLRTAPPHPPFAPAAVRLPWHLARLAIPLAGCFLQLFRLFYAFPTRSSLRTAPPHPPSLCSHCLSAPSALRALCHTSCLVSHSACPQLSGSLTRSSGPTAPPFPPLARAVPLALQQFLRHLTVDPHFTEHLGPSVRSPLRGPTLLPLLPARRSGCAVRTACCDSCGPLETCSMPFPTVS